MRLGKDLCGVVACGCRAMYKIPKRSLQLLLLAKHFKNVML